MHRPGSVDELVLMGEPTDQAARFRALAMSAPVGIYEIDPTGSCRFVNPHWCELTGIEAEAALGRGWADSIHPEDVEGFLARWAEASAAQREFAHEYRYLRPDGEQVWVAGRAVALRDDAGEVSGHIAFVIDVTDRRRAEAELERSEQRYRSTIEAVDDVVFRTDTDGRWTFLNSAWADHTGRRVEESIGRPFTEVVLEDDLETVERAVAPLIRGERQAVRYTHRYRAAGGEVRWADAAVRRIADADGLPSGYAGTLRDVTSRRAAEFAAQELAMVVDSSADAIISQDLDGTVTTWDPGAERVFGYSAAEITGRSIEILVPPGHEREQAEILDRIRAGERIENLETARMRKDRRRIDVALTISPIRDAGGKAVGASTIARDVSRHKAAERTLAESSKQFELSHDLVATCGFDGYFKRLNGAWETTLGWAPADLLPNPFIEIVHPDDREAVAGEVAKLATGGSTIEFRIRAATKAGGWRWTEWSAMPDVEAGLFYASGRDITDRVQAELSLQRERRQLADAQEIARVGSWELDPASGERTWSAQQYRNHGFDPRGPLPDRDEVLSRVHPDDRDEVRARMADLDAGVTEFDYGYRVVLPDGEVRALAVDGKPLHSSDGSVRLIGTSRDVTAERDADRVKDEFFGLISHELRTPLTSIIGYAELLAEIEAESLSEQGRRFIDVIERNSRRELSLVGDLLLLTRITAGTFEIDVGRADLSEISAATVEAARPVAESAGISLALDAPDGLVAEGDPHRLRQVFENLVSNAIKFTPEGGEVAVKVEPAGEGIAFEIADTGMGIAERDLGRLFDRMYRAEEAERRHIQGTGLGLTIVKAIVDAHEAAIAIESELGSGTTFRIVLPRRLAEESAGERAASANGPAQPVIERD